MDPTGVKYITLKKTLSTGYYWLVISFFNTLIENFRYVTKCLAVGVGLIGNGPASPLNPQRFVFWSQ